jgi:hypothetical protein
MYSSDENVYDIISKMEKNISSGNDLIRDELLFLYFSAMSR